MKRVLTALAVTAAMALAPAHAKPLGFAEYANGNEGGIDNGSSIDFGDGLIIQFIAGSGLELSGRTASTDFFPYFDSYSGGRPGGLGVCRQLDGAAGNGAPGADCFNPSDDNTNGDTNVSEFIYMNFTGSADGYYGLLGLTFRDADHLEINDSTGLVRVVWTALGVPGVQGMDMTFAAAVAMAASGGFGDVTQIAFGYLDTAFYIDGISDVPLPGAIPLLLSGLAGLGFASRKKKAA